jgi:DNA-3-methyladenine glycosylase I
MPEAPLVRCPWARSPAMIKYHDREWGTPAHRDRVHFEFLTLEGAQSGLSWELILNRRAGYKAAFAGFDAAAVAKYTARDVERLLKNAQIIRNRQKVVSTIGNARVFLKVRGEFGTFDKYVWQFVGGAPLVGNRRSAGTLPAQTDLSKSLSADLRKRGFTFLGPTTCYSYMQAVGLVNDHLVECFRYAELAVPGRLHRK